MTATPDQVIAQIREENAALAADRDAWIEAAIRQRKRAEAAEAERDALRKALTSVRGSIKNARGAVESNQIVDKDVHGTLSRAIRMIDAALQSAADTPPSPYAHVTPSADLRKRVMRAIFDPGATEGFKGERDLTTWQTDAVMRVLAATATEDGR